MLPMLLPAARPTAAWLRRFGLGLLLAMLLVQQVGLFHRYVHGAMGAGGGVAVAQGPGAAGTLVNETSGLPLHDKTACLLFDQLCVADAVPVLAMGLAEVIPAATLGVLSLRAFLPRWTSPFQARGPPFPL